MADPGFAERRKPAENLNKSLIKSPGGRGVLYQIVQHPKQTWTQSDIRFCENEGSNRFKINEKGGHLDRKSRRTFIQNA